VCEVSCLVSVFEDVWWFVVEDSVGEDGAGVGVGVGEGLAWSVDVEVS